jgi:hypothetical protein
MRSSTRSAIYDRRPSNPDDERLMPVQIEAFLDAYTPKFICICCLAAVTSRDEADVRGTVQMLLAERRAETRVGECKLQPRGFRGAAPSTVMSTSDTWHPPQVDGSRHDLCELRQIERLGDYGEKPFPHDPFSPRDEDYWHGDTRAPKGLENIHPREARHQHIEQNDVRLDRRHGGEDFGTSRHCRDVVALADEEVAQQLEDVRLVIGDQNPAIAAIAQRGPANPGDGRNNCADVIGRSDASCARRLVLLRFAAMAA